MACSSNGSNGQRFYNDQPSTSGTTSTTNEFCRLRHHLNSDCLVKVFEYLNIKDLTQLSKMDPYFSDLIKTQVIAKKTINLGELDKRMPNNRFALKRSTLESFQMFGKFMRKFVIRGEDFCLFLRTIIKYCATDRLTEIDLKFKLNSEFAPSDLIDQSWPFLTKLRKLKLFDVSSEGLYQLFMTKFSKFQNNVGILQLQQVDIVDGWLQNMQNLSELWIHTSRDMSLEDVINCCKANPDLKAFEYRGNMNLLDIYPTIAESCPRLQTFGDCHTMNIEYGHEVDVANRYSFLSLLKHLENVTLTSYTESGHDLSHLLALPALANISKFKTFMGNDRPIVLCSVRKDEIIRSCSISLVNLKSVEFEILNIGDKNCDLRCEFIFQLISRSKTVESMKFVGRQLVNVSSAFLHAVNLQRLCIAETYFRMAHHQHELLHIVRAARRVPIRHPMEEKKKKYLLHVNVNVQQWRELKTYQHSRAVMTTSIQS